MHAGCTGHATRGPPAATFSGRALRSSWLPLEARRRWKRMREGMSLRASDGSNDKIIQEERAKRLREQDHAWSG